jgi:putative redox protein
MNPSPAVPPHPVARTAVVSLETVEGAGMRFGARIGDHALTLDTGPGAAGPSPMDAVLAALGGCTAMDVISILRKQRQQVTGYDVVVTGERRMDAHPKVYTRIEVVHRVRGRDLRPAAVEEAVRLSETRYCAVHAMLSPAVPITTRFEIVPE